MGQILNLKQVNKLKFSDKRIILVGGCFDILHIGHITFLEKAKKTGDILVILLESDETIKALKGSNRPINSQKDRAKILSSLKVVDFVVNLPVMKNHDYDELVKKIKPSIIATTKGDSGTDYKIRSAKLVNAKLKFVTKRIEDQSTSNLVKLLSK